MSNQSLEVKEIVDARDGFTALSALVVSLRLSSMFLIVFL